MFDISFSHGSLGVDDAVCLVVLVGGLPSGGWPVGFVVVAVDYDGGRFAGRSLSPDICRLEAVTDARPCACFQVAQLPVFCFC